MHESPSLSRGCTQRTQCAHAWLAAVASFPSGKTHSICGSDLSSFEGRGIIPRAVGHIFRAIQARPDMSFTLSLSYVEIYVSAAQAPASAFLL